MLDERAFARNIAAATCERFAESAHPNIHIASTQAKMFLDAAATAADYAERVRFVDHQEGTVAPLDLNEMRQVGHVSVHAVQPLDHDQHALVLYAALCQQAIQCFPIIVR